MVKEITTLKELQEIAHTENLIVIDFYAEWCGPCKKLKPFFVELAENSEYKEKICFLKVDADNGDELCSKYSITGLPTVLFLNKQLKVVNTIIGYQPNAIQKELDLFIRTNATILNEPIPVVNRTPIHDIFNIQDIKKNIV
jgi:thioredoxin